MAYYLDTSQNLIIINQKMLRNAAVIAIALIIVLSSCTKRTDLADPLFRKFRNKVFKKLDTVGYNPVFRKILEHRRLELNNSDLIANYYQTHGYEPIFILKFLPQDDLKLIVEHFSKASQHGLNPEMFNYSEIKQLVDKFYDKKKIKTLEEAYETMALLEIKSAEALITYSNALQYGIVSPRKIFARYYMKTLRPDNEAMNKVFAIDNMKEFLDTIQPKNTEYLKLQEALKSNFVYQGLSSEQTKKAIALNLERLRWKNKPTTDRYVWVNIADYSLKYVENGKTNLTMKVCVGKGPEQEIQDADYDESENSIRPHNHQTPQLNSEIYNAQVNPIWNIPQSIAKNEIYDKVLNDPYYLLNNNIVVYNGSGEIVDSDTIIWSEVSKTNIPYKFKQSPGDDNSLGKIKFQFKNGSNVYLHDTPAQAPFNLTVRAVSHGCVRLEKPIEFANALFGNGNNFDIVKRELTESEPTSRDIQVKPKVPVFLDYMTCFVGPNGQIEIRPDVYQLDRILYNRMKKYLAL